MEVNQIISKLQSLKNTKNIAGMARFGISSTNTLGISNSTLREITKEIKKEQKDKEVLHQTALKLWESEIHEARILATLVDVPELMTEVQADRWVRDLDSWDVCDGLCMNLMDKTPFAYRKVKEWAESNEEFVRRAAFALIAALAVHDKKVPDKNFEDFFPLIKRYSVDERNFVRKGVNWALRQIGKRNSRLLVKAIDQAKEIEKIDSKSARWVAKNALKELSAKL